LPGRPPLARLTLLAGREFLSGGRGPLPRRRGLGQEHGSLVRCCFSLGHGDRGQKQQGQEDSDDVLPWWFHIRYFLSSQGHPWR